MNWRKRKKLWKRRRMWKPNHGNKSLHTMIRITGIVTPRWSTARWYMFSKHRAEWD